mmetsp:Transcript_13682/g.36879  ORF Transcript_13682/g.36879 Transcript_13682/m.36879 type:complete len:225 (+) Transcript_13682:72-746(+)
MEAAAGPNRDTALAGRVRAPPKAIGAGEDPFELHYIGELEAGLGFPNVAQNEGLFVDYSVQAGGEWVPIARSEGYVGQTQSAYADAEGIHVFNHPLDFHFVAASLEGWPRLSLQVLRLDPAGCVETVSYGSTALPVTPGHVELACCTWTPVGPSLLGEARAAHGAGGATVLAPEVQAEILGGGLPEARSQMVTKTSGTLRISLDTIFRNAAVHGILPSASRTSH